MSENFDFLNGLSAEVAEVADPARMRRQVENNPFVPWVQESYNTETGRAVTVENQNVRKTIYLIRQAAADLGLGVRVVTSLTKEEMEKASKTRKVKVSFQGKNKRKYSPKNTAAAAPIVTEETTPENSPAE